MRGKVMIVVLGMVLLGACNFPGQPEATQSPPMATATQAPPTSTPTAAATATPTPLPTATPTPIPSAGPACMPFQDPGDLDVQDFDDYPQAILAFLNQGADAVALDSALYEAGVANQPASVAAADFTGDQKDDFAVSIYDPQSLMIPPAGRLMFYVCQNGQYELVLDEVSQDEFLVGGPHLWYWRDMNMDSSSELVLSWGMCGAHTCYEHFEILSWDGSQFLNRLEGAGEEIPYPDAVVDDPDGDGNFDLAITGSGIGSVGAGPQRSETTVWGYQAEMGSWVVSDIVVGPSNFRIHVLHDADRAAADGDYQVALGLYNRAALDPNLDAWGLLVTPEEEAAAIAAFAQFRLVTLHLLMGDADLAEAVLDQMSLDYPAGTPQFPFQEMAALYKFAYETGGEEQACQVAQLYAESNQVQILEPLGLVYFGYANPDYDAEDMCPGETPFEGGN